MMGKFEGPDGRRLLIAALQEQRLVEHDEAIAGALADAGQVVEFATGSVLVHQGASDNDVFFILSGRVEVSVNGRAVANRHERESIGEMALLDGTVVRSATVTAAVPTLVVRVPEPAFEGIAEEHPRIWKNIAKVVAERLRERERFHRQPNQIPSLFLGSSTEGLRVARAILAEFKHDKVNVRLWSTPGVFSPGGTPLEVLLKEADACDFAAFVFGPDDIVASRGASSDAPRDNVVFELGLFMGNLDRTRAFIVREHGTDLKIPSDLIGITPLTYVMKPGGELAAALAPTCDELRRVITQLGPR